MWIGERKSSSRITNPEFQMCCAAGAALLAPMRPLSPVITDLLTRNDAIAKEFKANIRSYNSALSFTSMNADLDRRYANEEHGAYAFRIHGSVHHLISPELIPDPNNVIQQPRFAQIYIFDSANELQNRMDVAGNPNVRPETMRLLQEMMHEDNPFVLRFKMMEELSSEQPNGIPDIRMIFRADGQDSRRYNAPTVDEIGVLIVGGEDESSIVPCNRDIVLRLRAAGPGDGLQQINELNQHYDPLQYVLMFPLGGSEWNIATVSSGGFAQGSKVTIMQYYSSRLMIRANDRVNAGGDIERNMQVSIHSFGKLFHQYIVDQYAKMEQQRLNFIRFNQETLRAELYSGLTDVLRLDDTDMSEIGQKVILPSTFVGGPRFMAQLYQDAMNLVRRFGKPDLFITFTCNPAWPEIAAELLVHQKPADRPDLCARVFHQKLQALLDDIVKNSVLGKVVAYCYTIEFQKRGLPHCHMLFILDEDDKPTTVAAVNNIVSAEIPDPATHPLAHATVTTSMIHGPCGPMNSEARCMRNNVCTKKYPFALSEETTLGDADGDSITYRRRVIPNRTVLRDSGRMTVDNRWVVPHNLFLAAKYNAHINVEICTQFNYVKYVYKYIYKGHDRAQMHVGDGNGQQQQDEIKNFLDARYVSAAEACWRLFAFPMHKEFPACQRLDVHLPGDRMVYFSEDDNPQDVLSRNVPESTLTAWLNYNLNHPNDEEAREMLYVNFVERFTYHIKARPRYWAARRSGFGKIIGRMYTVSPKDIEKFHLRILLMHVPGATSFEDIRTFEGEVFPTFQAAARARGLLQDDTEWSAAMTEAAVFQPASSLRKLFCILIAFSNVSDPFQLWLDHRDNMAEDYLYRYQHSPRQAAAPLTTISEEMYGHCLLDLNDTLVDHRYDLRTMEGFVTVFPTSDTRAGNVNARDSNTFQRMHDQLYADAVDAEDPDLLPFNESQAVVYSTIRDAALDENPILGPRIYFVDGPGGTGKTFVFNALLDRVRVDGEVAIAVASSGTAALLLKGGRTAHFMFKIPLEVHTSTMCKMTPRSEVAAFIKRAKLIVWDECSMVSKNLIEAVNRSFQDIMGNVAPFGGCLMVFGGDFRQVLPIIRGASRQMIVSQCLNRASFWHQVVQLRLTVNMRVHQALESNDANLASSLQRFANYLLQVGQGAIPTAVLPPHNMPSSLIQIPPEMLLPGDNLLNLLRSVYFDILSRATEPDYFVDRCILTPKNKDVNIINEKMLDAVSGAKVTYTSHSRTCDDESAVVMPVEILNLIEGGSLPPHQLDLKVGSPIMVLRNIDPAAGLCNGTRLVVTSLGTSTIEAVISTGPKKGDIVLIPRIKFIILATEGMCPVDFQRTQFPVRLSFAMTINKAQGQTLGSVGLYLPCHAFGHGQLYVALSRVRTPASLKLMISSDISKVEDRDGKYTNNIVFREVFLQNQ
jgi:hypothetical protein